MERLRSEQSLAALSAATACAGLDVGEFAALVFAGALGFEDALRLVQVKHSDKLQVSIYISNLFVLLLTIKFHLLLAP